MLTDLPISEHKYELTTQGDITKLISDISLVVNDNCRDGKEAVLHITASGENNELSTAVRGERELELPYRTEINVLDDGHITLSPFNCYSNEIGTVIFLR